MIFVTVGTQFPFDRLVRAVDEALGEGAAGEAFAQVGVGGYRPRNMGWAETLEREEFLERVRRAKMVVGHAGTGTILAALEAGKPLLVMPRLARHGESVNDHQVGIALAFASLGHVILARDEREVAGKMGELARLVPRPRTARRGPVVARVKEFLDAVERTKGGQDG
ncbi:MAG: glycosyltransferase [Planctomycetota bacterium]